MVVLRRRLIFWLLKAYIRKSWKIIILFFLLGLLIFVAFLFGSPYLNKILPVYKKESVGVVGAYRQDTLPPIITNKFSRGLTKVSNGGNIEPDLAQTWDIQDSGKTYIFHLKKNEYFSNGKNVTSDDISYNFADVAVEKPDKYTIVFKLKDVYAPFLVTVSRGIFGSGSVGVGDYKIEDVKLNGNFIQSLTMGSVKNHLDTIRYQFYPTEEALKMAYLLGETSEATGLTSPVYDKINFTTFPNTIVTKQANYDRLVTLFYNTTDAELSDKKVRIALSYALPSSYSYGKKAYMPYSPESYYYNNAVPEKKQDFAHAKSLLTSAPLASGSAQTTPPKKLTIKTLKRYRPTAEALAETWKQIGIQTNIEEVEGVPSSFQVFLGDINVPNDPDQYTLWHTDQNNNITRYKNLRIDKLLEDGRKTVDSKQRKEIYMDFQKFLMEDAPASFLYFPYEYTLTRK